MDPALLLLADSRLPTGGHVHSGGVEAALARGDLRDADAVAAFLAARVPVAGLVTASVAAAAAELARGAPAGAPADRWEPWDAAVSARIPVAALREVSRAQGRAWLRTARATWPSPAYDALGARPHQALVLGVATAVAGGDAGDAAALAVHHLVGQICTAAVRLRGLDPLALAAVHARALTAAGDTVTTATHHGRAAARAGDPALLPALSAPLPDVLAVLHAHRDGTLFAS
jgi:urease accessory protein